MTEEKFIHTNLKNELTHDFLVEILKHYHYEQKDMEMLKEVAGGTARMPCRGRKDFTA